LKMREGERENKMREREEGTSRQVGERNGYNERGNR